MLILPLTSKLFNHLIQKTDYLIPVDRMNDLKKVHSPVLADLYSALCALMAQVSVLVPIHT